MRSSRRPYLGPLILIVLGVLLLLDKLGIAEFGDIISTYWPVILILIGVRMFFRYGWQESSDAAVFTGSTSEMSSPVISSSGVFGDLEMKVTSKDFRGGTISNTFGDMNIDLAEIELADGEQVLKLDGVFGDLHVLVPKNIELSVRTHSVFGDVRVLGNVKTGFGQQISYTSQNYAGAAKKLLIVSHQVFGDVKVW